MSEKFRNWIGHGVVLLVFLVAVWMLLHELKDPDGNPYTVQDILHQLRLIPTSSFCVALGLMVFSYFVLFCYDVLALISIGRSLPLWRVAIAAFVGHCCSFNFGALLGGTAVRYRLYSLWGLSGVDIVRLLVVLGVTFWVGALALAGVMFWWQPINIPDKLHLPFATVRPLAPILLITVVLYLGLSFFHRRPFRFRGHEFHLPSLQMALSQLVVASIDIMVAAAVLYVLLPGSVELNFAHFLSIYLLAAVGGIVAHVPGAVGILEVVVISFVASSQKDPVPKDALFASLLAFRVVYYLIPLFPALGLLAAADVFTHKPKPESV